MATAQAHFTRMEAATREVLEKLGQLASEARTITAQQA
jgi:methyl-accepting chemotaxis protein